MVAVLKNDPRPLFLNEWAADDLGAKIGDEVTLDYFLWSDEDGLDTAARVHIGRRGADERHRRRSDADAGVSGHQRCRGHHVVGSAVPGRPQARPARRTRTTGISIAPRRKRSSRSPTAQRLWGSRYGKVSSLRLSGDAPIERAGDRSGRRRLHRASRRAEATRAAQGTTDFGQYFLYFSFFLVVSALLLAYLFFAVGLEQRTTEVGAARVDGILAGDDSRRLHPRGAILAAIGAVIGTARAIGYSAADPVRPAHLVGRRGRHDRSHAARRAAVAGRRRGRRALVGLAALWLGVRAMSRRSARALLKGDAGDAIAARSDGHQGRRRPPR